MLKPNLMRRSLLTMLGASVISHTTSAMAAEDPQSELWRNVELLGQGGQRFRASEGRTPLRLLTLWAHWCPACFGEMPALASLVPTLGPDAIEVLLVSHPQYWVRDQEAARQRQLPFALATLSPANSPALVEAALTEATGAYAVPRALLFHGNDGVLAWSHRGTVDWRSQRALGELRARLS